MNNFSGKFGNKTTDNIVKQTILMLNHFTINQIYTLIPTYMSMSMLTNTFAFGETITATKV